MLKPDLCIIGGGSGGLTVAAGARAAGAEVVLIEAAEMGGDCLNSGCVPSKSLIGAAARADTIRHSTRFGIGADDPKIDFARVNAHVQGVVSEIAPHDSQERFEALGVTVLREPARFIDRNRVQAGETVVRARRFVVATGSRPAIPDIPGLEDIDYLTNETIFGLKAKPEHLVVLGGGPVGIELAQAYLRLGCKVTLIDIREPLSQEDPEFTALVLRRLVEDGLEILADTGVVSLEKDAQGEIAIALKAGASEWRITASHVLVATGRRANTTELGLEAARIHEDGDGIKVKKNLKTTNRRVYAIGDAAGGPQFTHVASHHGALVVRSALFSQPVKVDPHILPRAVYTDPEIAHVGMTEPQARARYKTRYRVVRAPFSQNDRAQTCRQTHGLVKLVCDRKGRVLGASIVGPQASETMALFSYAIANRLKMASFLKFVAPYPTLAEIAKAAAFAYYREKLDNPWLKRLLALNRLLP